MYFAGETMRERRQKDGYFPWMVEGRQSQSVQWEQRVEKRGHTERGSFDEKRKMKNKGRRNEEWEDINKEIEEMFAEEQREEEEVVFPDNELWEEGEGRWERESGWPNDFESQSFVRKIASTRRSSPELGEEDWNEDHRNLLLELGLAVEWNEDHPTGNQNEGIESTPEDDSAPVFMGLRLLPADHVSPEQVTDLSDIHQD